MIGYIPVNIHTIVSFLLFRRSRSSHKELLLNYIFKVETSIICLVHYLMMLNYKSLSYPMMFQTTGGGRRVKQFKSQLILVNFILFNPTPLSKSPTINKPQRSTKSSIFTKKRSRFLNNHRMIELPFDWYMW